MNTVVQYLIPKPDELNSSYYVRLCSFSRCKRPFAILLAINSLICGKSSLDFFIYLTSSSLSPVRVHWDSSPTGRGGNQQPLVPLPHHFLSNGFLTKYIQVECIVPV